jgi:hypothetical protein
MVFCARQATFNKIPVRSHYMLIRAVGPAEEHHHHHVKYADYSRTWWVQDSLVSDTADKAHGITITILTVYPNVTLSIGLGNTQR